MADQSSFERFTTMSYKTTIDYRMAVPRNERVNAEERTVVQTLEEGPRQFPTAKEEELVAIRVASLTQLFQNIHTPSLTDVFNAVSKEHAVMMDRTIPFGKYKTKTIGELIVSDRPYLTWCLATLDKGNPDEFADLRTALKVALL